MPSPQLGDITKRFLQLNPVNAISSGDFSPSAGLPLIKFDVSSTDKPTLLDLSRLRINGRITYFTGTMGTAETQVGANGRNFRDGFSGDFSNCVEHVTIASKRLNSVLERVTNYSRIIPSVVSGNHGENDINCELSHEGGHVVNNYLGRNYIRPQEVSKGKHFSAPLYCGIMNSGKDLDISINGSGGLTIELLLKPAVSACFGTDANANQVKFKLSDLILTCPAYELGGQSAQQYLQGEQNFEFNSITSIFQTLNSSASVVAITPGLSRVSSIFMNAINTTNLGNQNFNSNRLSNMGELRELRFSKNGILHPNQYRLFSDVQQNNVVSAPNGITLQGRCMIDANYLEAVSTNPIGSFGRTMLAYNNYEDGIKGRAQTENQSGTETGTVEGVGILFDAYGSGENFTQTVFSVEFDNSTLDGQVATTLGLYMFFLNKQVLMMSPNGISVQK
tara:strand:- start:7086 stop:8432 length:1347 start_codon:yes stop_codon:yes gene_type:complete